MKSYLRFLGRNKLYTAIEVVGLSVALAFMIILGSVLIDKSQVNDNIKDADEIYALATDYQEYGKIIGGSVNAEAIFSSVPLVKEWCLFYDTRQVDLKTEKDESTLVIPMYVTPNYFSFFGLELSSGDANTALQANDAVVLSRKLADAIFPGEDPVGKTVRLPKPEDYNGAFVLAGAQRIPEYVTFRVTGIIDGLGKCVLPEGDIFLKGKGDIMGSHGCVFRTDAPENIEDILRSIKEYPVTNKYEKRNLQQVCILPFEDIKDGEYHCSRYRHISDPVLFKLFVLICMVILAFSFLNYISLTLAFSRFRLKEAATRALLGTSRAATVIRSIAEATILVLSSYALAMVIVIVLKNVIVSYLSINISLLGDISVWAVTLIVAFITALIAGVINSLMSRRYRPIDIIKGESRYHDKSFIGKIFISIQSAICLATIVSGFVISLQTRKMTDYPVGYNRHNIISVVGDNYTKYIDELNQMHFVEKIGIASSEFVRYPHVQNLQGVKWSPLDLDQNAFDMLGLKVKEYLELSGVSRFNAYTTARGLELSGTLKDMAVWDNKYIGVLEDFHMGSVKTVLKDNTIFDICIIDDYSRYYSSNLLIKVSGDQYEAKEQIRNFFISKGELTEQMEINTLEELNLMNYQDEEKMMRLMVIFCIMTLLLTALAIIALSSYYAQNRTHDTAVQKVFGISRKQVFWKTVWGFVYPILIGAVVSLPVSYIYMARWLQKYPVRIDHHIAIYIGALIIVLVVTLLSVVIQSLRLMRTNPAEALKKE